VPGLSLIEQRAAIRGRQWEQLRSLLDTILVTNAFHRRRLQGLVFDSLETFSELCPLMTKRMLVADRETFPPYGSNLTYPIENYTRFCQTSGTTGPPLTWLDSRDDWSSMLAAWHSLFAVANLEPGEDRLFFPFSFGPFLGFWTAFEAASRLGCMVIPGGGMSTVARLQLMLDHQVTVIATTPTYALYLGEQRMAHDAFRTAPFAVRLIIVAGEPGGSQTVVRDRLASMWPGVVVFDHHGLTETGPVSYQDPHVPCQLKIMEEFHFAEIIDPKSGREVEVGEEGELIISTLTRLGCPMLRYRTGDIVRKAFAADGTLSLAGGILHRLDDMVCVRGVNVYPAAVDAVVRQFSEVHEYQVREIRTGALLDLAITVEPHGEESTDLADRIAAALRDALQLRIEVTTVASGTLPKFEFKAKRWLKES
jgi:phenylacetate-CoA ligase